MSNAKDAEPHKSKLQNHGQAYYPQEEEASTPTNGQTTTDTPQVATPSSTTSGVKKPLRKLKNAGEYRPDQPTPDYSQPKTSPNMGNFNNFSPSISMYMPQMGGMNNMSYMMPGMFAGNMFGMGGFQQPNNIQPSLLTQSSPSFNGVSNGLPTPNLTPTTSTTNATPTASTPNNEKNGIEDYSNLAKKLQLKMRAKKNLESNPPKQEESSTPAVETKPIQPVPVPEKKPESVRKESGSFDDDNSEESKKEPEEDFSHLPQERPNRIVYTREMIMEWITKEAAKKDEDYDNQFEDLTREIQIIARTYESGGFRDRGGKYSSKRGGDNYSRPSKRPYNERRENDRYGNPERTPTQKFARQEMTTEQRDRLKELQGDQTNLQEKAKNEDVEKKETKEINFHLNRLVEDNFKDVFTCLRPFCDTLEGCEKTTKMIIDKAWSQGTYTELFAKLITILGDQKFEWFEKMSEEDHKKHLAKYKDTNTLKIFKQMVVNKVRTEFVGGFEKFRKHMHEAEDNPEFNDERKTTEYNKARGKFLSSMTFIAELYKKKYLPHKVMRTIAFLICDKFMVDFCNRNFKKYKFACCEVYLQGFFQIMENAGIYIEEAEAKEKAKEMKEPKEKWEEAMRKKGQVYINVMIDAVNKGEYSSEKVTSKFGDADKKEVNFVTVVFNFIQALKQTGKISVRLNALIETALDSRSNKWRSSLPSEQTPKYASEYRDDRGGRRRRGDDDRYRKRYEDEEEYYTKREDKGQRESKPAQPSAKSLDDLLVEVKSIFELNKKTDDVAVYTDLFKNDNEALKGCQPVDLVFAFLKLFTMGSRQAIEARAMAVPSMVKNFNISEKDLWAGYAKYLASACNEDIPVLKKVLGMIAAQCMISNGFDIDQLVFEFDSDEDEKENQTFFYEDVMDEIKKELESNSADAKLIEAVTTVKKTKLK